MTFVEIILCSSMYSNFIRFYMCLKRIYSTIVYYNQPFFLSLSLYIYMHIYTYTFKFACNFYIIMVFFIYELLRGKSKNYFNYCKFVISPYNLSISIFTDIVQIFLQIFYRYFPFPNRKRSSSRLYIVILFI